jgi:hypothetical protein
VPEQVDKAEQRAGFDPFKTIWNVQYLVSALQGFRQLHPELADFPDDLLARVQEDLSHDRHYEVGFSDGVPREMWHALERYAYEGMELGSFLQACVANDLGKAIQVADQTNRRCLNGILFAVWSLVPGEATGSYAAYHRWIDKHKDRRPPDTRGPQPPFEVP